jgi:hypothetical protein|eukprot:CAMPEP_0174294150 /NCGR_PEP_ID=MMETSP0809-20121228/40780_1 /TAXON_ID=73025 ORGANISM="Eutreptiella gymnastica-like, Strain CCMP1594" /NCGR_SAMPLE_ID=MMETSP0809 /ASSEMBLY_ACC=CAM_ASM_000658 /LENGTH=50 /DNA_ID=CAMNT_0015395405 /DNA_START=77 /DNA_END=229 /DNA_ORIENTATION=-
MQQQQPAQAAEGKCNKRQQQQALCNAEEQPLFCDHPLSHYANPTFSLNPY